MYQSIFLLLALLEQKKRKQDMLTKQTKFYEHKRHPNLFIEQR